MRRRPWGGYRGSIPADQVKPPAKIPSGSIRHEPMPDKFESLAVYQAEVLRGLVHTDAWKRHMADLQQQFDVWADDVRARRDGRAT